jgi:hypothetical protein
MSSGSSSKRSAASSVDILTVDNEPNSELNKGAASDTNINDQAQSDKGKVVADAPRKGSSQTHPPQRATTAKRLQQQQTAKDNLAKLKELASTGKRWDAVVNQAATKRPRKRTLSSRRAGHVSSSDEEDPADDANQAPSAKNKAARTSKKSTSSSGSR